MAEASVFRPDIQGMRAIAVMVVGFNLFGDALRDAFDPRLTSRFARRRPAPTVVSGARRTA